MLNKHTVITLPDGTQMHPSDTDIPGGFFKRLLLGLQKPEAPRLHYVSLAQLPVLSPVHDGLRERACWICASMGVARSPVGREDHPGGAEPAPPLGPPGPALKLAYPTPPGITLAEAVQAVLSLGSTLADSATLADQLRASLDQLARSGERGEVTQ